MTAVLNFYMDESGPRHPNHDPGTRAEHGYDWFAIGGVMVKDSDEDEARELHRDFCGRWGIEAPLHSSEIRSQNEAFVWLRSLGKAAQGEFYEALYQLMRDAPVTGIACVIDRPGYNERYSGLYEHRWLLCKTAFNVVVERAAKHARSMHRRLRLAPEKCNPREDKLLRDYYEALKSGGMPFASDTSSKYAPLAAADFRQILYELKPKAKSSPMAQLADLYLWPICMGGYHAGNRPYRRLFSDGKLIECLLPPEALATQGSKYSCFEMVERKA